MNRITQVVKRSGAVVDFTPGRITNAIYRAAVAVGGRDRATAERLGQQVVDLLESQKPPGYIPHIEEIQDLVEKVLIENGHARVAKAYILYRDERRRMRAERAQRASQPSENIPWSKIWHVLDWAVAHDLHSVEALNERLRRGEFGDVVKESEAAYNEDVENAAEIIASRAAEIKTVIIAGPSSSGKTTTTARIAQRLKRMGMKLVTFAVDHYFFDLASHPKDEFGDYDFETPQALDLALIDNHLARLIAGEEVLMPFYDFKTGTSYAKHTPMKVHQDEIILIDSLHGLYADMTKSIPMELQFRLYLEPLMQLKDTRGKYVRWTDLRLIRRMLRDAVHRAYDPRRTLEHWHYVRASELRNIIPCFHTTDYIVNSAMPYELPVYCRRMLQQFVGWEIEYRDDPLRNDAYLRAARIAHLLQSIEPACDGNEDLVPSDSVLREFIGGSCFEQ